MLTIGITTSSLEISEAMSGGIGVYTKALIEALLFKKQEVIPCYSYPLLLWLYQRIKETTSVNAYQKNHARYKKFNYPPYRSLNKFTQKINILHVTNYLVPKIKSTIPIVITLHDAIFLKHPQWCNRNLRYIKNAWMKRNVSRAQHVIVPSFAMIEDVVNYWAIKPEKISVIYPGLDTEFSEHLRQEAIQAVLEKYNLTKNFLLFVGILQPRKNVERIIEAYQLLSTELKAKHKLVIIGSVGWQAKTTLSKICSLEISNEGRWLSMIPRKDLRILYHCADIVVFPSLSEGFGYPIIEGFASQTPVITSNTTSMPEIAGEAAYLVNPYNVEEISQAMVKLLTDGALRKDYIQRGTKQVLKFSWDKNIEKLLGVYKRLL